MSDRDLIDVLNTYNQHRTASAAKQSAENLGRIASAQEANAKAARIQAEAEAEARRVEAKAAALQASIEQQRYNQEINLKNAKTELVRFSRSLDIDGASIADLSGSKLHKLLLEQDDFKRSKKWIKESISFEHEISEIERLRDTLNFVEEASDAITQNPIIKEARLIIREVAKCDSLEAEISKSNQDVSKSEKLLAQLKEKIIKKYGVDSTSKVPARNDYLQKCKKDCEQNLDSALREKYYSKILGYPLLGASVVTLFSLGVLYAIPEVAISLYALNVFGKKSAEKINSIKSGLNKDIKIFDEYSSLSKSLPKKTDRIKNAEEGIRNQIQSLIKTLNEIRSRGNLSAKVITQTLTSCNGQRFFEVEK